MLGHIYRLVSDFEKEHGIQPNLLYLNRVHSEQLKFSFDQYYTMSQIMEMLNMEMILAPDIVHPHVSWSQVSARFAS